MGLNVFPVSSSVFRRERIRGHPSAQAALSGVILGPLVVVTVTLVASVSGTSSIVARDALSFWPIANVVLKDSWRLKPQDLPRT